MGLTGEVSNVEFESKKSSDSRIGYMAGALVGGGISEQVLLSLKYRYWYSDIGNIVYHTWSWCGDLMFFPSRKAEFFLNGGVGRGLVDPDVAGAESKWGLIFYGGVGYEITRYVFLALMYHIKKYQPLHLCLKEIIHPGWIILLSKALWAMELT